jgi:pyrophosphatase PpaX
MAILFDLDGTLVDTVPFILAAVRHAFDGYGRCPSDAEWVAGIGTPLRAQLEGFADRPEDVPLLLERYRAFWLAEHDARTRCFPGALEAVVALAAAGHPIGVVTAKLETGAYRTLRHTGLLPYLGAVIGADSCARAKPHPEPVLLALSRLERRPEEALFVGDSPHDLAAGRAAGTRTAAALWGACSRDALSREAPDHLLDEVGQVLPLVGRLAWGHHP